MNYWLGNGVFVRAVVIWTVPKQWREGLIVNLFKKGDREDSANFRGITLLCAVHT